MTQINFEFYAGMVVAMAFFVNIVVQLTKEYIPLPTKLWTIIVAVVVSVGCALSFSLNSPSGFNVSVLISAMPVSFMVAYIAMYGFDTAKELWEKFKGGANINDNN